MHTLTRIHKYIYRRCVRVDECEYMYTYILYYGVLRRGQGGGNEDPVERRRGGRTDARECAGSIVIRNELPRQPVYPVTPSPRAHVAHYTSLLLWPPTPPPPSPRPIKRPCESSFAAADNDCSCSPTIIWPRRQTTSEEGRPGGRGAKDGG